MNRKLLTSMVLLSFLMLALAGCKGPTTPVANGDSYPLVLTDSFGREVNIPKQPETIVSLSPSSTEILFALGLGDKVIGVTDACDYPEEALAIEKMGGYQGVNVEGIVAAKPDLIIADSLTTKEVVEQLASLGLPVLAIRATTLEEMLGHIELIGKAANVTAAAEELTAALRGRLAAVSDRIKDIPDSERPLVFYEVWHDALMSAGPNTFISDAIVKAGGRNMAADASTDWPMIDLELLLTKNPEVVLIGHDAQGPADVKARSNWQTVAAVINDQVYSVNPDLFSRPGPRLVDAVEEMAKLLYPDLFK
mgnify:CR=1 FL=1